MKDLRIGKRCARNGILAEMSGGFLPAPSGRSELSRRQAQLYELLARRRQQGLSPPSYAEIMEELGLKSKKSVEEYLTAMEHKGYIRHVPGQARSVELVDVVPQAVRIPVIGPIAAGPGIADESGELHWTQLPVDWIDLPLDLLGRNDPSQICVVEVKGDSMVGDGVFDGDRVIVRRQQDAVGGDLVVAGIRDELTDIVTVTIKRYQRRNGRPWLMPANPDYEPIDAREALILGKAIGLLRFPL
jgi:repressor LexA